MTLKKKKTKLVRRVRRLWFLIPLCISKYGDTSFFHFRLRNLSKKYQPKKNSKEEEEYKYVQSW